MTKSITALTPQALAALMFEPNWADLDPAANRLLAVDLRAAPDPLVDVASLARWLMVQPVPVVGVGANADAVLRSAVDLIVDDTAELERVAERVAKNPLASAVLVQVLRATAALRSDDALMVESLAYATLQSGQEFAAWLAARRATHPPRSQDHRDDIVLLRRTDDGLEVVLNDPARRNALSAPMRDALTEAFKLVAADASIVGVTVSANGACFSSGGDLDEFGTVADPAEAHRIRMLRMPARYLCVRAPRYHFRVHGACIGAGIELPAFAGRLTATADTYFNLPEVAMGLIPGAGGCVSIPRRIGRQRTAYMAILGDNVPAERALAWGLIDAIVD